MERTGMKRIDKGIGNRWLIKIGMLLTIGMVLWCPAPAYVAEPEDVAVRNVLQERFSGPPAIPLQKTQETRQDLGLLVREFYARRDYRPAWYAAASASLRKAVLDAEQEGLNPADYHLGRESNSTDQKNLEGPSVTAGRLADRDIRFTETFLTYGLHLSQGRLDPQEWFFQWVPHRRSVDLLRILQEALEKNEIESSLKQLVPRHPTYGQMRKELAAFRKMAASGGWPLLPGGTHFKRGDHGRNVVLLKQRLMMAGDLAADPTASHDRFDGALDLAVRKFQWRHGLAPTGLVDKETRQAMNIPVEQRIRLLEINMERWRWLPDDFGPRYVMTIIPDLWLYVVDDQKTVLSMKTVIGTPKQPSPIFSDEMSYVELNPTWGLPQSIVAKEIIPKVRKDAEYLSKKRIRIYENWSEKAKEIPPQKINWAKINPEKFPYRMIQDPGVNPLGRIKFMFPNEFDVYLHDTTQRNLFKKHRRLYSHGCIRVEKPFDLGEWVLRDDPSWSRKRLMEEIKKGKRLQVGLPRTVPVHVMYLTAWVDGNGVLQFREDYYGYDKRYEETLKTLSRREGDRLLRGEGRPLDMASKKP